MKFLIQKIVLGSHFGLKRVLVFIRNNSYKAANKENIHYAGSDLTTGSLQRAKKIKVGGGGGWYGDKHHDYS